MKTSFFLGIDVSKGYADFVIINAKKQVVLQNFQLDDTFQGHCRLHDILQDFLGKYPGALLFAGMENTGGYEKNWYQLLSSLQAFLPVKTTCANPLAVVSNSKADLKRNKTDKISAQNVAEYLVAHPEKVNYQQHDPMASLRKQWGFVQMLTKQSTQFYNQLNALLYSANTELLSFCKDGVPAWMLTLLTTYPTALQLKKARPKTLAKIPYITLSRAQQLIAGAKRSVASTTDQATAQLIVATTKQILHLKKTINTQMDLMEEQSHLPEVDLLKTFVGISTRSAIGLMLEIQSISRFKTSKKLAAFWGVHPVYNKSGDGSRAFRMSKKGRKEPRRILFQVALSAINHNPVIKPLYEQHVKRGKEKMDAIGVCMHKITRIIYGMLKNNTAFDPSIDEENRQKWIPAEPVKAENKTNRRFEDYDPTAPVSRRQHKKRMERERSHSVNDTKRGITAPVPIGVILTGVLEKV